MLYNIKEQHMIIKLTENDNNSIINASIGDKVQVDLLWKPSSGYFWQDTDTTAGSLEQLKHDSESTKPGAAAIVRFIFKIAKSGFITLSYARPWNETDPPVKWFQIEVKTK
jgi:predicted secreted protein